METNKEKTTKVMEEQNEKLDPVQLKGWCDQLLNQRNQLVARLNQITDIVNKLPWLFKVIENKEVFPDIFVKGCSEEIIQILTPSEDSEENKDTTETKE